VLGGRVLGGRALGGGVLGGRVRGRWVGGARASAGEGGPVAARQALIMPFDGFSVALI
jgi:hypothetical protein